MPLEDFDAEGTTSSSKVKNWAVEEGMKLNKLISNLPIITDASEFSLGKDWIVYRLGKKSDESKSTNAPGPGQGTVDSCTASWTATRAKAQQQQDFDFVKSLGLGFCRRGESSIRVSDRAELEVWREENHVEMGWLYQKMLLEKEPKRKKEKVKGWVSAADSGVQGAIKMRKGKTGLMVNVRAEDFDKVKKQLEQQAIEDKRRQAAEAEEALFNKNFHNSFPPWLGTVSEGREGGLVWEIRKPFIIPALRHILRGLIQSCHVYEIESIIPTKNR